MVLVMLIDDTANNEEYFKVMDIELHFFHYKEGVLFVVLQQLLPPLAIPNREGAWANQQCRSLEKI